MAKFSTLVDNFESGSIDTGKWVPDGSSGPPTIASGTLDVNPPSSTGAWCAVDSVDAYDLSSSEIYIQMVRPLLGSSAGALTSFRIYDASDGSNWVEWIIDSNGDLTARSVAGFVPEGDVGLGTWSSTNHKWLKMSMSGTTVTWWTAPDAGGSPGTWTSRRTDSSVGSTFTSAKLALWVDVYGTPGTISQSARFDGVNTSTTSGVSAALTGQAATSARGTLGVSRSKALTGQAAASARGTLGASYSKSLTGQAAASARGALGVSRSKTLTGEAVTSARGTPGANLTTALTGDAAAAARGALVPATAKALTGQTLDAVRGSLANATAKALTGEAIATDLGELSTSSEVVVPLDGLDATVARGSVDVSTDLGLTGQEAETQRGEISPSASGAVGLIGLGATTARGALAPSLTIVPTGRQVDSDAGAVSPELGVGLTGQAVEAQRGTPVLAGATIPTVGAAVAWGSNAFGTVAFGGDADSVVVGLTGHGLTTAQGPLNRQFEPVTITGHGMTAGAGALQAEVAPPGDLASIPGHRMDAGVGRLGVVITVTAQGVPLVLANGVVRPRQLGDAPSLRSAVVPIDLTHVDVPFQTGAVVPVDANIAVVPSAPERATSN